MTYPNSGQSVEALPASQLRAECRREAEDLERKFRDAIGWLARQLSPRVQPIDLVKDVERFRDASLTTLLAALIACMRHPKLTAPMLLRFAIKVWTAILDYRPLMDVQAFDEVYAEDTRSEAEADVDQAIAVSAGERLCIPKLDRMVESTEREVASSLNLLMFARRLRERARRSPSRLVFR